MLGHSWLPSLDELVDISKAIVTLITQDQDGDEDGLITFQEFGLNGGLDHVTRTDFKNKFLLGDNKLNYALLDEEHPVLDIHGAPSAEGMISRMYKMFKAVDTDKVFETL